MAEIPEKIIIVKGHRVINPERLVYEISKMEGCKLLTVPKTSAEEFEYEYKGKLFKYTMGKWFNSNRKPHEKFTVSYDDEVPPECILREVTNCKGYKTHIQFINPEFIRYTLKKFDCELLTEPIKSKDRFCYLHDGKKYWTTWTKWNLYKTKPHEFFKSIF